MESPIIRIRLDPEIAREAYGMAAELGMELPDVVRMMLNKAVRIRSFSIDKDRDAPSPPPETQSAEEYEPRYWEPLKGSLAADLALALLHRTIAELTTSLDEGLARKFPDVQRLERVRDERDAACQLLADFDPKSAESVAQVLAKLGGRPPASATSGPGE